MNFGVLRVLNDDTVAATKGFGKHPHDNMEIVSIPLSGDLEHKDSMGNVTVIKEGDVQIMSAGTGVYHSEYNKNADEEVRFLQIWMIPNKKDVTPRYGQISIDESSSKSKFQQILSPDPNDDGVWSHQNAWFYLRKFEYGEVADYDLKSKENGVYIFVIEGRVIIEEQELKRRDGYGIWDTDKIKLDTKTSTAMVLLMEVPMHP